MGAMDLDGIPEFGREFLESDSSITRIGSGSLGGKASGLLRVAREVLSGLNESEFPEFQIDVPTFTVLTTDLFDEFIYSHIISTCFFCFVCFFTFGKYKNF